MKELKQEDAVKESLHNIFKTLQGSRRMLPTFAMNLHYILFDPIDEITAKEIGRIVLGAISQWENRVILDKIRVIPDKSKGKYDIILTYGIINYKPEETFEIKDVLYAQ